MIVQYMYISLGFRINDSFKRSSTLPRRSRSQMSATSTYDDFFWCQQSCAYRLFSKLDIGVSACVPWSSRRLTRIRLSDGAHNNSSGKKDGCEEQFHVQCLLCLSGVQYLLESKQGYSQCLGGGLGVGICDLNYLHLQLGTQPFAVLRTKQLWLYCRTPDNFRTAHITFFPPVFENPTYNSPKIIKIQEQ